MSHSFLNMFIWVFTMIAVHCFIVSSSGYITMSRTLFYIQKVQWMLKFYC